MTTTEAHQASATLALDMEPLDQALSRLVGEVAKQIAEENESANLDRYFVAAADLYDASTALAVESADGQMAVIVSHGLTPIAQLQMILEQMERHCTLVPPIRRRGH